MLLSRILLFFLLAAFFSACTKSKPSVVGTWRFVADQKIDNQDRVTAQDTAVRGMLVYTKGGKMSIHLLWAGRRADIMNDTIMKRDGKSQGLGLGQSTWTFDQTRRIIDTYDGYFGTYILDEENHSVIHRLNGEVRPEKEFTEYHRIYELRGDTLLLRSSNLGDRWQTAWVRMEK